MVVFYGMDCNFHGMKMADCIMNVAQVKKFNKLIPLEPSAHKYAYLIKLVNKHIYGMVQINHLEGIVLFDRAFSKASLKNKPVV